MIRTLVQSAFQTGYLSVESEALLRQVLSAKCYQSSDIEALKQLYHAVSEGQVKREARCALIIPPLDGRHLSFATTPPNL